MGGTEEGKIEKKDKQPKEDKHTDGEPGKEEKKGKKEKKKDKECKKEKNPEDKNDPQKLRQKLEKVDAKMQALAAKREEILKSIQEAEQKAKAAGGEAAPAAVS
ncbi:uncharacterized protein J3R85_008445 [Psidium guajava]|nr:uncharacterized protein J3R85_008445 [Psidium guajava]